MLRLAEQEFSAKQRSVMDERVGEIYEDFVGDVAAGRKMSVEEVGFSHIKVELRSRCVNSAVNEGGAETRRACFAMQCSWFSLLKTLI